MGMDEVAVRNRIESDVAGWFSGAPSSFQLGSSSSSAIVSITAPDRMWLPTEVSGGADH